MLIATTTTEQSTKKKSIEHIYIFKNILKASNLFSKKKIKRAPTCFACNEIFIEHHVVIYRNHHIENVPGGKVTVFCEVIISAILNKKVYMYMSPIPNGFRYRAISLYSSKIVDKKKRYYVLFVILVFIVQVMKLVQYN
jgi:hypothetical protein